LALHELDTNAAKHGALSSSSGKLSLEWGLGAAALTLHWVENGGPPVAEPSSRSFGLKVIAASIEQQLGGKAAFDWNRAGLRCLFAIPRTELTKSRVFNPSLMTNGGNGAVVSIKSKDKARVLLVE